ncbi:MAG TPA: sulfite exporter TauE/SafE family protein [Pirellulaceae bacterium]|nr:sulfite exporter TauE/SafE family protein [Pirellulaceae bacterium]
MIEWPFLIMAGMLGSSHCIGMCGGFALTLAGSSRSPWNNLGRQMAYTTGRLFTYSTLGGLAGFVGWRLTKLVPSGVHVAAVLAIVAGLFLLYQGLVAAGVWRRKSIGAGEGGCLAGSYFGAILRAPGFMPAFLAGLFTGLLPCGLLYGMIALAASTHDLVYGLGTMAIFGLGTAPVMIATGWGGSLLNLAVRKHIFRIAAWSLVLTGAISVVRGVSFLTHGIGPTSCPFCH